MSDFISDFIEMVCPKCGGSGKQGKKDDCDLCAGCESGPGARQMDVDWVLWLRDQCVTAGVPFFLKQMKVEGKMVKMPALVTEGMDVVWDQMPK